jgi:uncharacterized membrane protein YeiH
MAPLLDALPTVTPFAASNGLGLVAFALVGSLKAAESDLDLLGVAVAGMATALGGGVTRDVLVGRTPGALTAETDVVVALVGVVAGAFLSWQHAGGYGELSASPVVALPDAVGLAAFATSGALVGTDAGLSAFGVVTLATITGVGGSVIRDVMLQEVPFVLHEDFYATCAVVGGVAYWLAAEAGVGPGGRALACAGIVLLLRVLALRYDWSLPSVGSGS